MPPEERAQFEGKYVSGIRYRVAGPLILVNLVAYIVIWAVFCCGKKLSDEEEQAEKQKAAYARDMQAQMAMGPYLENRFRITSLGVDFCYHSI